MIIQTEAKYPSLSICLRYHDVLDRKRLLRDRNIKLKYFNEPGYNSQQFYSSTRNLTISDLFEYSPFIESILPSHGSPCQIRYAEKYEIDYLSSKRCYEQFKISKYLVRENVCFLFRATISDNFLSVHEYNLSPGFVGVMYRLFLAKDLFVNIESFLVAIHSDGSDFIYDTLFSANKYLRTVHLPTSLIAYREFSRTRMEKPYDTQCVMTPDNSNTWYEYVMKQVDEQSIKKWNLSIPFNPTFDRTLIARKIVNYRTFRDKQDMRAWLVRVLSHSAKNTPSCHVNYFTTRSQITMDNRAEFTVFWTQDEKNSSDFRC